MKVEIFTTPTCKFCLKAKEFFNKHNIKYTEHNVIQDKTAARTMIEKSEQNGVPVILIDNDWDDFVLGFDEQKLKKKLNIK